MTTFEKLNKCLRDNGCAEATEGSQQFCEDLGLDSLDCVELSISIEDEFGFEASDADIEKIKTVQQAVEYIDKRLAE